MIGIISDVHGNHPALRAVLAELDRLGVTSIVSLGDVAGYGCQLNACCDTLRSRSITTLQGNHDWYLVSDEPCPTSKSANVCLDYQRRTTDPAHLRWLAQASPRGTHCGISMVHGGWRDPLHEYFRPVSGALDGEPGEAFASGHTHVPVLRHIDGRPYCNPGSVGQPRDGDPRASFATWDGAEFALHRVVYDVDEIQDAMRAAGFDEPLYANLAHGTRIGGRVDVV